MLVMGCCVFLLINYLAFHLYYVASLQKSLQRLVAIERAQEVLGHLRQHERFIEDKGKNSDYHVVVDEYPDEQSSAQWICVKVICQNGMKYSLCTVAL